METTDSEDSIELFVDDDVIEELIDDDDEVVEEATSGTGGADADNAADAEAFRTEDVTSPGYFSFLTRNKGKKAGVDPRVAEGRKAELAYAAKRGPRR